MPLVQAKCTNCGANLPVDSVKDAAICSYCGAAFVVEKAINNYNISSAQINAHTVNVYNNTKSDFDISNGILHRYNGNDKKVVIPDTVQIIGNRAFSEINCITSIIIPDSVNEIEEYIFAETILSAFNDCVNLEEVTISKNISKLDAETFSGCDKLYSINFKGNLHIIDYGDDGYSRTILAVLPDDLDTDDCQAAETVLEFLNLTFRYEFFDDSNEHKYLINNVNVANKLKKLNEIIETTGPLSKIESGFCPECGGNLKKKIFSIWLRCQSCGGEYYNPSKRPF